MLLDQIIWNFYFLRHRRMLRYNKLERLSLVIFKAILIFVNKDGAYLSITLWLSSRSCQQILKYPDKVFNYEHSSLFNHWASEEEKSLKLDTCSKCYETFFFFSKKV